MSPAIQYRQVCSFDVVGIPISQGSKDLVPTRRGPRMIESRDAALKRWRASVGWSARAAYRQGRPLDGPVRLEAHFRFVRPKRSKQSVIAPTGKPDLSKLVRAIEDALTQIVWYDDAQVVEHSTSKIWATSSPGVTITVLAMVAR